MTNHRNRNGPVKDSRTAVPGMRVTAPLRLRAYRPSAAQERSLIMGIDPMNSTTFFLRNPAVNVLHSWVNPRSAAGGLD